MFSSQYGDLGIYSNHFDFVPTLCNQMMVVEWVQKQCVIAWVSGIQIKQNWQLDNVRTGKFSMQWFWNSLLYLIFYFLFGLADGNGFKTGSMRLGADVIVFSCHLNDMYGFKITHVFMLLSVWTLFYLL